MELFFLGVTATVAGGGLIFGIYKYVLSRPRIVATIKPHEMAIPKRLEKTLLDASWRLRRKPEVEIHEGEEEIENLLDSLEKFQFYNYTRGTFSKLHVENMGSKEVKDVEIKGRDLLGIEEVNENTYVEHSVDEKLVFNLRPGESKKFRIWQKTLNPDLQIVQSKGKPEVKKYYHASLAGVVLGWIWDQGNVKFTFPLAVILAVLLIITMEIASEKQESEDKGTNAEEVQSTPETTVEETPASAE